MFGSDISVMERLCFVRGQRQDPFHARRVGIAVTGFRLGSCANQPLDLGTHLFQFKLPASFAIRPGGYGIF